MIARLLLDAIFLGTALLVIGGGILASSSKNMVHSVLGLIISLMGVAGLYLHLSSAFLFTMQILIYVGAVCIIIIFAIMLAEPGGTETGAAPSGSSIALGLLAGLSAFVVLLNVFQRAAWVPAEVQSSNSSLQAIGKRLLLDYGLVFEMISLVLLVAMIGAIVLARGGRATR